MSAVTDPEFALMARVGRRPGNADTRGEILAAARHWFAAKGYGGATIRAIAATAGVDPALVHHYFGSKRDLFVAAVGVPFNPVEVIAAATEGDPEGAAERILRLLLQSWGEPEKAATMQSLLRSALTDDQMLVTMREFILQAVLTPIAAELAPDRSALRASLLASQVMGLALVRHVIQLEPLASASDDTVVAAVAPNLQRYLTGDI